MGDARTILLTEAIKRDDITKLKLAPLHVSYQLVPDGGCGVVTIQPEDLPEDTHDFLLARCKESFEYVPPVEEPVEPIEK